MAAALGQHTSAQAAFAASVTTGALTTSATGSTFVVFVFGTGAVSSVTDNNGNTYTLSAVTNYNGTLRSGYYAYCQNGAGGSGHTFTATTGGSNGILILAVELTGAATSGGPDNTATPVTGSSSGATPNSLTPNSSNTIVLNAAGWGSGAGTVSSDGSSGFALIEQQSEATYPDTCGLSWTSLGAPSAVADTLTTTGGAGPWAAFSLSFASATYAPALPSGGHGSADDDYLFRNRSLNERMVREYRARQRLAEQQRLEAAEAQRAVFERRKEEAVTAEIAVRLEVQAVITETLDVHHEIEQAKAKQKPKLYKRLHTVAVQRMEAEQRLVEQQARQRVLEEEIRAWEVEKEKERKRLMQEEEMMAMEALVTLMALQ